VIILAGKGYSLLWPRGKEIKRFDWQPGSLVVPPGGWFHQHFNSGNVPVRYLALRWGSQKYHEMWGEGRGKADVDVKLGGNQIEYEDEDMLVRKMFDEACATAGVQNLMEKYYQVK
jgi:hypothetical protein